MRILFALHQFYPEFSGGTERAALNLARSAQRAGHYVHIVAVAINLEVIHWAKNSSIDSAVDSVYQGVPITFLSRNNLPPTADYSFEVDDVVSEKLAAWIENERFNLAHIFHTKRIGSLVRAVQNIGLPYILTLTDFFPECFLVNRVNLKNGLCQGSAEGSRCAEDCLVAPWTRETLAIRYRQGLGFLSSAALRVCPSEFVAKCYQEAFQDLEFKVIPHGVDFLASLASNRNHDSMEESHGLTLGYVGSIVSQKGLDILLQALRRVSDASLRLVVVGGMYGDEHYLNTVRAMIRADDRVRLVGRVDPDRIFEVVRDFDLLCIPSRVPETFSLVLHEAAVLGIPALVSNLGAPGEYIVKHGGGLCLPPDDIQAWADAIISLLQCRKIVEDLRHGVDLPLRVEEEAFFYELQYRKVGLLSGGNA